MDHLASEGELLLTGNVGVEKMQIVISDRAVSADGIADPVTELTKTIPDHSHLTLVGISRNMILLHRDVTLDR